jgi:hypothetical protein
MFDKLLILVTFLVVHTLVLEAFSVVFLGLSFLN